MHFRPQWTFPKGDYQSAHDYDGGLEAVNPQPNPWEFPFYGFEKGAFTEDNRVGPYGEYLKKHGFNVLDDPHSFTFGQHTTVQSAWPKEHHQTAWIANKAIDFLQDHSEETPFFMWVSFIHPHSPFNPPAPYDTMYDPKDMSLPIRSEEEISKWPKVYQRRYKAKDGHHGGISYSEFTDYDWQRLKAYYYGMIHFIDDEIGHILDALREKEILDQTLIVFTSDHGEMMGDHHLLLKGTQYDCVTNVPFLFAPPKSELQNKKWNKLCQSIDIMPTILEYVNVPIPKGVQGQSILSAFSDPSLTPYDDVLIEMSKDIRTLRTEKARISWHSNDKEGELYDLEKDPYCLNNLWNESEAISLKQRMMESLLDRMTCNQDPLQERKALC